ncbi:hypothetical protein [Clostridium thailandense]|uniref:hypothetical protein n=1 Tax=Clostridium thailandense TaxID=2794346 RepID=UPI00398A50AC
MENGFFSINIPSSEAIDKTDFCGCISGNKEDKSNALKVKPTIMMGSGYFDLKNRVVQYLKHTEQ